MTDVLSWRRIGDRTLLSDDLDTRASEDQVIDPRINPARWSEERFAQDRLADLIEDLPRGLVDAYVNRAVLHSYTREIEPGIWFSTVAGLDGAWGDGDTPDEALSELRDALIGWVAVKRRLGCEIPAIEGLDLNLPRTAWA